MTWIVGAKRATWRINAWDDDDDDDDLLAYSLWCETFSLTLFSTKRDKTFRYCLADSSNFQNYTVDICYTNGLNTSITSPRRPNPLDPLKLPETLDLRDMYTRREKNTLLCNTTLDRQHPGQLRWQQFAKNIPRYPMFQVHSFIS